ncbi:type II toxin-antitoxin system RelE/ParE family toxin [bacterium]|nr:type II toxin-antitoxin system RelE/ParE family toxin [bacterium]QQR58315.1 MAG: type II toxin-antitoxin system RelE/ParE family toxin [Candidatus Melainabacteria bacterium]
MAKVCCFGDPTLTNLYVITDNSGNVKPIIWLGNSKRNAEKFPFDWKPMSSVGSGVIEIRIHHRGEFRVIYVSKFSDAIYILSTFQKKTEKTPRIEMVWARKEYAKIKQKRI